MTDYCISMWEEEFGRLQGRKLRNWAIRGLLWDIDGDLFDSVYRNYFIIKFINDSEWFKEPFMHPDEVGIEW